MKQIIFLLTVFSFVIVNDAFAQKKETIVLISTTLGDMKVKLYNETPVHRDNFIKLVNEKFYDGVVFHRVIKEFMIQGGDPNSKEAGATNLGTGGPGYTLPAEILPQFFHKKGALSAARTGDQGNPQRRSSGSQFYVVQGKTYSKAELDMFEKKLHTKFTDELREAYTTIGGVPHLDAQYTVFGEVIEGLEVIDKIAAVETDSRDKPTTPVKMTMKIVKK